MAKEVTRAVMRNIGYLTQLGFSIAFPMVFFTMGSVWLMNRFQMGGWIVIAGVLVGLLTGVSGFTSFVKYAMKDSQQKGKGESDKRS